MEVVFVHAHPDDESIWTGGAIAACVNAGCSVHVITATLGELERLSVSRIKGSWLTLLTSSGDSVSQNLPPR